MTLDRRNFLVLSGIAAATQGEILGAAQQAASVPWHQKLKRVGQVNMNERDPVELDINAWADYWADLKVDAVLVSVTGIVAFYPTNVPYHRKTPFLGNRDFFGDCCNAAKKRGIRVIARMSPDLQWGEALKAHPEWFHRNRSGQPVEHSEVPGLFRTCMFSTYYTGQIPAIMREVNSRYDVDGIFTNAWPPLGQLPDCQCDACRGKTEPGTPAHHDRYMERTVNLWKLFDAIAKEKKPDNLYFANLGGGIRALTNLKVLAEHCYWFNATTKAAAARKPRPGDARSRAGWHGVS